MPREEAKMLDVFLALVPGIVLARVGTAALKAAGKRIRVLPYNSHTF